MSRCKGCNKEFIQTRKKQQYHDRACFLKSTVRFIKCPECGKEFQRKFSGQICCTSKCAVSYRAKKNIKGKEVTCVFCGKLFHKMPSRIKKEYNFCSRACTISYLRSPQNISMSKGWHHTPEAKEKIKKAGIGRKITSEHLEKIIESNRNRVWTDKMRDAARQRRLGKKNTEEQNNKIKANAKYGAENIMFKGKDAGYVAKHLTVKRYKGKAQQYECVDKGLLGLSCSTTIQWSNKDHQYNSLSDYSPRCVRHHRAHDLMRQHTIPKGKHARFFPNIGNSRAIDFTVDGIIVEEAGK